MAYSSQQAASHGLAEGGGLLGARQGDVGGVAIHIADVVVVDLREEGVVGGAHGAEDEAGAAEGRARRLLLWLLVLQGCGRRGHPGRSAGVAAWNGRRIGGDGAFNMFISRER